MYVFVVDELKSFKQLVDKSSKRRGARPGLWPRTRVQAQNMLDLRLCSRANDVNKRNSGFPEALSLFKVLGRTQDDLPRVPWPSYCMWWTACCLTPDCFHLALLICYLLAG